MDPIQEKDHYTYYLREPKANDIQSYDGFVFKVSIHTIRVIINDDVIYAIKRSSNPVEKLFPVRRDQMLAAAGNDSTLSQKVRGLELPVEEHGKLVSKIHNLAVKIAARPINEPPKLMAMEIIIEKWRAINSPNSKMVPTNGDNECSICLEKLSGEGAVIKLACGHEFHLNCMFDWMSVNRVCPMCGIKIPVVP